MVISRILESIKTNCVIILIVKFELQLKNKKIPWKGIMTSLPIYAMIVAVFASDWSFLFMATFVPSYLDDVFQFDLKNVIIFFLILMFVSIFLDK